MTTRKTLRQLRDEIAPHSYARRQAIANVRFANLPVTPELLRVYERYTRGEITLEQAFRELKINADGSVNDSTE